MSTQSSSPTLIVAGGGSGGHIWAGVAVADAWRERFKQPRIIFVGSRGGIEERLVPKAGYPLELIEIGSLNGVGWKRQLRTLVQLPLAILRSMAILLNERPSVVLGVGGYASGPVVLTARLIGWIWGAHVAILEQNVIPGMTNRLLGRFAHRVFAAFSGLEERFSRRKVFVTGNPIRSTMKPLASASRDPFTVFIFGGSQGAMGINTLVLNALPDLADLKGRLRFIHQTGERDYDRVLSGHRQAGSDARVEKFIYEMLSAYSEASLLICRAGSSTLSEIAAVGRASILIPLVSADRHQEPNAKLFADSGASCYLDQKASTGKDLAKLIRKMMDDPSQLDRMEARAKSFYRPQAAQDLVQDLARSTGLDS